MQVPVDMIGTVYQLAQQHDAERLKEEFLPSGEVSMFLQVRISEFMVFNEALQNATSGQAHLQQQ